MRRAYVAYFRRLFLWIFLVTGIDHGVSYEYALGHAGPAYGT
jgi:hypothetical protein